MRSQAVSEASRTISGERVRSDGRVLTPRMAFVLGVVSVLALLAGAACWLAGAGTDSR